jgi:hypothetical protein
LQVTHPAKRAYPLWDCLDWPALGFVYAMSFGL